MTTQDIFNAVLVFDEATVVAKTQAELDGGTDIGTILNDGLIGAMDEVGEKFQRRRALRTRDAHGGTGHEGRFEDPKAPPVRRPEQE